MVKIRRAKITDVRQIHRLLNYYAERKELLPRALSELYEGLQRFFVAEAKGKVIGCCALYVTWDDLCEVKALAVAHQYHGKGIGKSLLETCLSEARSLGISRVFCLTMQDGFFKHYGFTKIGKNRLPHKVWTECVRCPYFPDACVEISMVKTLGSAGARRSKGYIPGDEPCRLPKAVMVPSEPNYRR